jgi:hypothetical protein
VTGLVSVLMPVRNEAASVAGAVASVLAQTYPDVEVLVVDGRSDDATGAIVAGLAAADPRVRLLDNPDRAISPALNVGLAAARGEFVARVDAHATVNDAYLALGVAHLQADPGLAAVGGRRTGVATTPTGRSIALALSSPFGVGNSLNHYASTVQETDHASFRVYRTTVAREVGEVGPVPPGQRRRRLRLPHPGNGSADPLRPGMLIFWHVRGDRARPGPAVPAVRARKRRWCLNGPAAVRLRHLAAPALVVELAGAGALAVASTVGWPRRPQPRSRGGCRHRAVTWRGARRDGEAAAASLPALPAAFVAMHTAWGLGFLEGLAGRTPAAASQRDPR